MTKIRIIRSMVIALLIICLPPGSEAQPVTGVWHGKVSFPSTGIGKNRQVELKLVRNGDSLAGLAYYHNGGNDHFSIPVSGYFNPYDGTVRWWHAGLEATDEKGRRIPAPVPADLDFVADFNCPGEGIMKLDGEVEDRSSKGRSKNTPLHLSKTDEPLFRDEWDDRIEDPAWAVNTPQRTDIEGAVPVITPPKPPAPVSTKTPPKSRTDEAGIQVRPGSAEKVDPAPAPVPAATPMPKSVEELFVKRKRILVAEIPVSGDTLELDFYDHAEIDGDSISIFLNNRLLEKNILLKAEPYRLKIPVSDLGTVNELTMVAENLGTIPPNTSLMITYVGGVRYETRLESTEATSAMIRFLKSNGSAGKAGGQ